MACAGGVKDTLREESGNDRLFGQDGGDTLNARDGVQGNDLAGQRRVRHGHLPYGFRRQEVELLA